MNISSVASGRLHGKKYGGSEVGKIACGAQGNCCRSGAFAAGNVAAIFVVKLGSRLTCGLSLSCSACRHGQPSKMHAFHNQPPDVRRRRIV